MGDFSHLPTHAKFIVLMPRWDFLDLLAAEARDYPTFTPGMGWQATCLLYTTTTGHGHTMPTNLQTSDIHGYYP